MISFKVPFTVQQAQNHQFVFWIIKLTTFAVGLPYWC